MKTIETERLVIRNFMAGDWQDLKDLVIQKESSPYAVYDHEFPTSENEIKRITDWFSRGDSFLAVCLRETGKFIGYVALNGGNGVYDLGYCFNLDYQGKGYATEGCTALIDYTFAALDAEKMTSGTAADNHSSCNLLSRLGFTKVSKGTASFRKTPEGKPIEFIGYSFELTRDEWLQRKILTKTEL